MTSDEEIRQAVAAFCAANEARYAECGQQRALNRLRSRSMPGQNRQLGAFLVRRYRRSEKVTGPIDWEKFRKWLADHAAEINAARLVVSIITLLLLL